MKRPRRFGALFLSMLISAVISPSVHAQPAGEAVIAESLFQEGKSLMENGQVAEACRKFEESYRLDEAHGTLLNIARCHHQEGRIASAWSEFIQVAAEARLDGRNDREKIALARIKELELRVPKLAIVVPSEARVAGLTVRLNGTELKQAAWGTETRIDPGRVVIDTEAPGYKKWSDTIEIEEAESKRFAIPVLVKLPTTSEQGKATDSRQPVVDEGSPASQTTGLLLGGVGLVGVGIGSFFGVKAIQSRSDAEEKCTLGPAANGCPDESVKLNQDAKAAARIANVGIGAGLLAILAGTYLYLDGAPQPASTESAGVPPLGVGVSSLPGGAFATVHGGWRCTALYHQYKPSQASSFASPRWPPVRESPVSTTSQPINRRKRIREPTVRWTRRLWMGTLPQWWMGTLPQPWTGTLPQPWTGTLPQPWTGTLP